MKVVSANANILQTSIHLDKPGKVHMSANTSARSASPVQFQTGVYNGAATNIVWTDSFRNLSLPTANQWAQVGTMFAIDLPAGDHTIYWKIWVTGASLSLSSGTLMLEGFEPAGGPSAVTAAVTEAGGLSSAMTEPTTVGVRLAPAAPDITMSRDELGRDITTVRQ